MTKTRYFMCIPTFNNGYIKFYKENIIINNFKLI